MLSIIIPAAGTGARLNQGPKSLIDVGRETVLQRQLRIIRNEYPKSEIIVVLGYEAEKVARTIPKGIRVVENENYSTTNVVRSIALGLRAARRERALIVYGDLVFNHKAVTKMQGRGSYVITNNNFCKDDIGITTVNGNIGHMDYGLKQKWAQICYLEGAALETFYNIVTDPLHKRWFGFEALNALSDKGGRVRVITPRRLKITDIDSPRDIRKAIEIANSCRP